MNGMDMSNVPTAAILRSFYLAVVGGGVIWGLFMAVLWRWSRRQREIPVWSITDWRSLHGRSLLIVGLGCLWILDGLLQAQPDMSSEFVPYVLVPMIDGQPLPLANLLIQADLIFGRQPMAFDVLVVWLQVTIGTLILWPNTRIRRVGLRASIVWAIGIWIFGQGMGGLFTGAGNWFTNAPGSALFYMLAAGLLLCESCWADGRVYVWMRRAFVALFLLSALLQAWPDAANWQLTTVTSWVQSMAAMKQPTLLSHILRICAQGFTLHPVLWNALFTLVSLALGFLWLFKPQQPLTYRATIVWLAYTWYVGQDFGVFGGLGTDPGSAVILALLLVGTRNVEGKGEVRG